MIILLIIINVINIIILILRRMAASRALLGLEHDGARFYSKNEAEELDGQWPMR